MATKVKLIAENAIGATELDLSNLSTTNISEGDNLYYTDARVDSRLSSGSVSNIEITGYLRGPSTFTIDPAAHGDATGTLVVLGNLQVDGTTTTINSTTMEVDDLNITLASGAANAAAADGAGLTIDGASATLTYYSTPDAWSFNKSISIDTNSPRNSAKFTVAEGKINAGTDTSVGGSVTLENYYGNGATAAWGTTRSSGGAAMLYGVYPSTTAQTEFTSSTGIALNRGAYVIDDVHRFYAGSNQTVAVGSNVTMSEVMRIESDGKVGIGTDSPQQVLQISQGASAGTTALRIENTESGIDPSQVANAIEFYTNDASAGGTGVTGKISHVAVNAGSTYALTFSSYDGSSLSEAMRIDSSGNVGIGQSSPAETLHIGSGQSNYIRIHNAASGDVSSGIQITRGSNLGLQIYDNPQDDTSTFNAEGNINFRTSNQSYRLFIKDNGNISIGTTDQASRLNLNGPTSGSLPVFDIQTTGSAAFMRGVRMLGTQMAAGNDLMYAVGAADSARNMGQLYFNYSGTSGSTDNSLRLGLHSVDHMLNLWGSGDVGIGKGTGSLDDPKPRAPFHVKKGGILFNGVGDDTQTTHDNNWTWFQCSGVSGTYSSAVRVTIPDVNGGAQSVGYGSFSMEVYVSGYDGRYCHAYYSAYVNTGLSNGELATRAASSGTWTLSAGLEGSQGFYLNIAFPGSLIHPSVYVRVTKGGHQQSGKWTPLTNANINWT